MALTLASARGAIDPPVLTIHGVASCPTAALSPAALDELAARFVIPGGDGEVLAEAVSSCGGTTAVPRGLWRALADAMPQPPTIRSEVSRGAEFTPPVFVVLRPYQEEAVQAMVARVQGVIVAPCGSGKTVIGLGAVARAGCTALVLVHTHDLARQWAERAEAVLGVQAGVIGGGKDTRGPVTVALMQTLARWPGGALRTLGQDFGALFVDESHHAPCDTLRHLVAHLACRYRWGLTATPERADGLTPLLHWIMGPEIHRIEPGELIAEGHLIRARVETVQTGWTADLVELAEEHADRKAEEKLAETGSERAAERTREWYSWDGEGDMPTWLWSVLYAALAADADRNALIVRRAADDHAAGHTILILARLKEHCAALARGLDAAGVPCEPLTGDRTKRQRGAILGRFRAGDLRCLTATSLADEGLDVPRLDRVILASPQRSAAAAEQRLGRLLRPAPDKPEPVLVDLVDDVGCLHGQAAARRRVYRRVLEAA